MERRNEEIQLNNIAGVHVQGEEGVTGSSFHKCYSKINSCKCDLSYSVYSIRIKIPKQFLFGQKNTR